ncbi:LysR family transcriptional regulator [Undibacterium sp. TJN19]|uniref:LysR family transcriptional regulator n=1 Tax=Undibacterium sp. TJN19 TaxID=3413055 RepID=UPI003BF2D851
MIARTQYKLTATDLDVVLALVRTGTLAEAGERLGLDASTIFRTIQKMERGLAQRLFERSRSGYAASETALQIAQHAEKIESELEAARQITQQQPDMVAGKVKISTTDTILHGLIAPSLIKLAQLHPHLSFDLHTGNELASLTRHDTDIAVRATKHPPQHLLGKNLGAIRVALFAPASSAIRSLEDVKLAKPAWIAPDEALPDHPSVLWRKKNFPKVLPAYRVNSILSVMEMISLGLGVGVVPLFLAHEQTNLVAITGAIEDCTTDLWILMHPEARHLRRVDTVFKHLRQEIRLM